MTKILQRIGNQWVEVLDLKKSNGTNGKDGRDGKDGKDGRDGKDANLNKVKPIVREMAEKITDKQLDHHNHEFDHSLIHDVKMLGTLELDEDSLKEGAILQIQGNKLVAVDMPTKDRQDGFFARAAAASHSNYKIQSVSSSTGIDPAMDILHVDASGGDIDLTFFAAAGNSGRRVFIKRIDDQTDNDVTFVMPNSETIDFATLHKLVNQGSGAEVYSDGTNFFIKHS